ncbi:MAG: hypothetical protein M0P16_01090 [Syntrophales bacterium]|jgi:hypothetical protein|nr:hypothetical protein [Syntrophales bacterium]MCK9390957.1 hypothetical protein [Syntrophales bacterium]
MTIGYCCFCHSGLDPESSIFKKFWTSVKAGVTAVLTICEPIILGQEKK